MDLEKLSARPDELKEVSHTATGDILVTFADGESGVVLLSQIGFSSPQEIRAGTWRVANWGTAAGVKSATGEAIDVDSAFLRSCIDPEYAAQLDQAIAALGGS